MSNTPTPWAATTRQGSWDWVVYSNSDPNIEVGQLFHDGTEDNPTGEANAALIVKAVNAHDALVKALSWAIKEIERNTCTHEETHRGGVIWTMLIRKSPIGARC